MCIFYGCRFPRLPPCQQTHTRIVKIGQNDDVDDSWRNGSPFATHHNTTDVRISHFHSVVSSRRRDGYDVEMTIRSIAYTFVFGYDAKGYHFDMSCVVICMTS